MVQILPAPDISGQLQTLLFGPLQQGIQSFVSGVQKRQEKAQMSENATELSKILGVTPEEAQQIFSAPPAVQKGIIDQISEGKKLQQAESFLRDSGLFGGPGKEIDELTPEDRSRSTAQDLTMDQLVGLQAHPNPIIKQAAGAEFERRKLQQQQFEADRKFAAELARPFLKSIDESRDGVRLRENAIDLMENALANQDLSFFSADNWANMTGLEVFRTAKGAQLINAQKEFLLGNLRRAGPRPNQWIEQQIANMLPKVGRSNEANETVMSALKAETQIERKKIELSDQIRQQMKQELGFVDEDIGAQVDQALKPFAKEIQNQLAYKLRNVFEREQGLVKLQQLKKVPQGTPLTLEMAQVLINKFGDKGKALDNAKKMGFVIPTREEFQRWTQ